MILKTLPNKNRFIVALVGSSLLLSGCSTPTEAINETITETSTTPINHEASSPQARLVTTYDGGILTLDADTLEVLDNTEIEGFNRLNSAGDGRHIVVSTAGGFQLFDAGAWTEPHGDHTHSYTSTPQLTDITFPTDKPGHVVKHSGTTVLFGDGDGKIQTIPTGDIATSEPTITNAIEPHHGVAVALPNGQLLQTLGTEDSRNGAIVMDQDGTEIARNEECPGVHGEAAAGENTIALGCEDGVLIFKDGNFTKIQAPDVYGRIGNQAGSEVSPVILGDYKTDKDADLERPTRISLTNTETGNLSLIDLDTSYSFRSLGRGPVGEAVVLGTDGQLHIIDPLSGDITNTIPVVEPWTEPEEWQEARPTLYIQGERAYITEPINKKVHIVDLISGDVLSSAELPETPNELTGVSG